MKKLDVTILVLVILAVLLTVAALVFPMSAISETMYVNVSEDSWLRGRSQPSSSSDVECRFYKGDEVNVLAFTDDYQWAQLDDGGEAEHCWVSCEYLTTSPTGEPLKARVKSDGRVKVRKKPDGKTVTYVKNGDVVNVAFFFEGWARTSRGWVKSAYLMTEDE